MRHFLLFFSLVLFFTNTYGQGVQSDTTTINALIKKGKTLLQQSQHEESIRQYEKAKQLAKKNGLWEKVIETENDIIHNLWRMYRLKEAFIRVKAQIKLIEKKLDSGSNEMGNAFHQNATITMLQGQYDSAIYYFDKAINIRLKLGKKGYKGLSAAYTNMAYLYMQIGGIEKRLEYCTKAYEIDKKLYGTDHLYIAEDLSNISSIHIERSEHSEAIDKNVRALEILRKVGNKGSAYTTVLSNLGSSYANIEEFDKSYDYLSQALNNNIRLYGTNHINNASHYQLIAKNFLDQKLYDSSIVYYNKGFEFENQLRKAKNRTLLFLYRGTAFAYLGLNDSTKALDQIKKAIRFSEQISKTNEYYNFLSNDLGRIYVKLGQNNKAQTFFKKSIELYQNDYGLRHTLMTGPYRNLAEIYKSEVQYKKALACVQKSLMVNHRDWKSESLFDNPPQKGVYDNTNFLLSLLEKAKILAKYNDKTDNNQITESLLNTHDLIDQVIQNLRRSFTDFEDKISFQGQYKNSYQLAFNTHFSLYKKTGDKKFLRMCFHDNERSKSSNLYDATRSIKAKEWANIPDALQEHEKQIKANLTYYRSTLNNLEQASNNRDSIKIKKYKKKIFDLNQALDSVIVVYETNYPSYYQIKYDTSFLSINDIQGKLSSSSALIEYFTSDSTTYAFLVTKDDFTITSLAKNNIISEKIDDFRSLFRPKSSAYTSKDYEEFVNASQSLYNKIVAPLEKLLAGSGVKNLTIIPDGKLNYIPFDLLITSKPEIADFKQLPYLFKKYTIKYNYSSVIEYGSRLSNKTGSEEILAFAPGYESRKENTSLTRNPDLRNSLQPLKWNHKEVDGISKYFKTSSHTAEKATESTFKSIVNNYEVIHLAMHAFIDNNDPMNSNLVFSQINQDSLHDGLLHTFELYNMNIKAKMAVLSACETGYGKNVSGDGIISLARGFAYAGVPSVVMSHWQVDDQSTSKLMELYYKHLSNGNSKSKALKLAKLDFLETIGPEKGHPFFWGAFVIIGEDTPITTSWSFWPYSLTIIVIPLGLIYYLLKKQLIKNRLFQ